tara:strand:+ start:1012 stop:1998 length:987 start_codon:yes stop_codon:yes gene_type:complete
MKIAVVGATGMVGKVMLEVLTERKIRFDELILVASQRSVGKKVSFQGANYSVVGLNEALNLNPDIALFSAGAKTSLEWSPKFADKGTIVIDNSSAWRMNPKIKLIVPEINASTLNSNDKIIANPNCSTIQLVMVLHPLHNNFNINRVVISTYQSVTGTGVKALNQLENEYQKKSGEMAYPYQIHQNAIPHCDVFLNNDYTKEEMKLINETHKILNDTKIGISPTAVRIPVIGGHSESVNIEFNKTFQINEIKELLNNTKGVVVKDNPETNIYPMPFYAKDKDEVFVGRIRKDESKSNAINLWIVSDNLRKGAATNTVQIAEHIISNIL